MEKLRTDENRSPTLKQKTQRGERSRRVVRAGSNLSGEPLKREDTWAGSRPRGSCPSRMLQKCLPSTCLTNWVLSGGASCVLTWIVQTQPRLVNMLKGRISTATCVGESPLEEYVNLESESSKSTIPEICVQHQFGDKEWNAGDEWFLTAIMEKQKLAIEDYAAGGWGITHKSFIRVPMKCNVL